MIKYILGSFTLMAVVCKRERSLISPCIQQKITELQSQPKTNPPAQINEYIFNGKRVYLFSSECCDQYDKLLDASCNYICAPSGGITGQGDGKCKDFSATAQHVRLVWKDQR